MHRSPRKSGLFFARETADLSPDTRGGWGGRNSRRRRTNSPPCLPLCVRLTRKIATTPEHSRSRQHFDELRGIPERLEAGVADPHRPDRLRSRSSRPGTPGLRRRGCKAAAYSGSTRRCNPGGTAQQTTGLSPRGGRSTTSGLMHDVSSGAQVVSARGTADLSLHDGFLRPPGESRRLTIGRIGGKLGSRAPHTNSSVLHARVRAQATGSSGLPQMLDPRSAADRNASGAGRYANRFWLNHAGLRRMVAPHLARGFGPRPALSRSSPL